MEPFEFRSETALSTSASLLHIAKDISLLQQNRNRCKRLLARATTVHDKIAATLKISGHAARADVSTWEADDLADIRADVNDFHSYLDTLQPADRELLKHIESLLTDTARQAPEKFGLPPWHLPTQTVLVERYIGGGSFGEAYEGYCKFAPGPVCVKRLNIGRLLIDRDDLAGEIDIWARLHHANVATLRGACLDADRPFLVTDYFRNSNLTEYLRNHPGVDRLDLISDIAKGINFLHQRGIIHSALIPSNVLISDSGRAVVSDWGFLRLRALTSRRAERTEGRQAVSMPPEQIASTEEVPSRAGDAYAFAMLCYELWSNKVPFEGVPPYALVYHVVKQGHRPHMDDLVMPEALRVLIRRCWDQDPSLRPTFSYIVAEMMQIRSSPQSVVSPFSMVRPISHPEFGMHNSGDVPYQSIATDGGSHHNKRHSMIFGSKAHPFFRYVAEPQGLLGQKTVYYKGRPLVVEESFEPSTEGDLRLQVGAMVAPVEVFPNGMIEGLSLDSGEYGRFPA
ncbi:hypothetical protein HDU93_000084 [Gonapodya sp. JEL0774]|nr:hypothetical protein HDU93_000084 [Gonapodya sp. JEL0774]